MNNYIMAGILFCIVLILVSFFYMVQREANRMEKTKWKPTKEERMLRKLKGGII